MCGYFFPLNFPVCLLYPSIGGGLMVACPPLPVWKTQADTRTVHVALPGPGLAALRGLAKPQPLPSVTAGPAAPCWAGGPGGGASLLTAAGSPLSPSQLCIGSARPWAPSAVGRCARRQRCKLLLFGVPGESTRKERRHQCHGPALLLSFLQRRGKNQ